MMILREDWDQLTDDQKYNAYLKARSIDYFNIDKHVEAAKKKKERFLRDKEIFDLVQSGVKHKEVARRFNISSTLVTDVVRRSTWQLSQEIARDHHSNAPEITSLNLDVYVYNALIRNGIHSIAQVVEYIKGGTPKGVRGIGTYRFVDLRNKLIERGYL